ncbi:hypothetical protein [Flavobacterium sp.]|uniref:hypothetical protein n=1 Tax=Flavobacterium sp. TaxID=239 RepID=UPI00286E90D8|nr:hypothetical protein [Flavobacterium sp.]
MKTLKISIILAVTSYVWFSCDSATYDEISGKVANPTYKANVKAIIDNNCLSCHSTAGAQYPTMETYLEVREAAETGSMICRIDDQSCGSVMPQSGRMPQANINTIKKWAANGYPN